MTWQWPSGAGPVALGRGATDVGWQVTDDLSGAGSAVMQRQLAVPVGATCPGIGWGNDGRSSIGRVPIAPGGSISSTCSRWPLTVANQAGNGTSATSVEVLRSSAVINTQGPNRYSTSNQ